MEKKLHILKLKIPKDLHKSADIKRRYEDYPSFKALVVKLLTDYLGRDVHEKQEGTTMKKSLYEWIKENRTELDKFIQRACLGAPKNDNERRLWVLNDEGLYNWARSEGVNV